MTLRNYLLAALTLPFSASSSQLHDSDNQEHPSILNGPSKNIAIIGAGAAGSSAAYHLSQYAAAAGIATNITVFERSSHVGGRSTTVAAWDDPAQPVELGASIFVKVNHILMDAVARFNLSVSVPDLGNNDEDEDEDDEGDYVGIWNGRAFVFRGDDDALGWWDTAKLLWKYGLAPLRTRRLMKATVGDFLKLYEAPHFPWRSLTDKVMELGLLRPVAMTGERFLRENGIGELWAGEVVQASTRVNYAQNLALINGLITMVCMATDGAKSVPGGNWRIFSSFLSSTPHLTTRLNTSISSITQHAANSSYTLTPSNITTGTPLPTEHFDAVILAAPYHQANISVIPAPANPPLDLPFVTLHVTLLSSPHRIAPSFFGQPASAGPVPRVVLTTLPPDVRPDGPGDRQFAGPAGFFSVSTLRRGWNPKAARREYLYKVFSPMAVDDAWLARLFGAPLGEGERVAEEDVSWVYRKVWQSYPYETPRVSFDDACLDCGEEKVATGGLWYTGGMEGFISTMETSALMGRNVARLMVDGWVQGKSGEEGEVVDAGEGEKEL
ncbi:Prenylcysteine lyase-domain-containing protein [Phyllosticta capitalensis]|uniref:Prenylcysteine lyase-domain-containing protein n=1 Tax=Phyllosticta capitalensis TaxID=121624 RepID=A0ABR1YEF0_9PEZI